MQRSVPDLCYSLKVKITLDPTRFYAPLDGEQIAECWFGSIGGDAAVAIFGD